MVPNPSDQPEQWVPIDQSWKDDLVQSKAELLEPDWKAKLLQPIWTAELLQAADDHAKKAKHMVVLEQPEPVNARCWRMAIRVEEVNPAMPLRRTSRRDIELYYTSKLGVIEVSGHLMNYLDGREDGPPKPGILGRFQQRRDLGSPTTGTTGVFTSALGSLGFLQQFTNGLITTGTSVPVCVLTGETAAKFLTLTKAWPSGVHRSMPTTGSGAARGGGQFVHLGDQASIYWSPATGAHLVAGPAHRRWADLGWEASYLGFPIADTRREGALEISEFQRGTIYSRDGHVWETPAERVLHFGPIHTKDSMPVRGEASLTLYSNGYYRYSGHFHCSGAGRYDMSLTVYPKIAGQPRVWYASGDVEGSFILGGHRDHKWDHGMLADDWIASNWDQLATAPFTAIMKADFGVGDALKMVGSILAIPVIAIGAAIAGAFISTKTDACGGYDSNGNPTVVFVGKGEPCPPGFYR